MAGDAEHVGIARLQRADDRRVASHLRDDGAERVLCGQGFARFGCAHRVGRCHGDIVEYRGDGMGDGDDAVIGGAGACKASEQGGGNVVGMPLDCNRLCERIRTHEAVAEEHLSCDDARDDACGA